MNNQSILNAVNDWAQSRVINNSKVSRESGMSLEYEVSIHPQPPQNPDMKIRIPDHEKPMDASGVHFRLMGTANYIPLAVSEVVDVWLTSDGKTAAWRGNGYVSEAGPREATKLKSYQDEVQMCEILDRICGGILREYVFKPAIESWSSLEGRSLTPIHLVNIHDHDERSDEWDRKAWTYSNLAQMPDREFPGLTSKNWSDWEFFELGPGSNQKKDILVGLAARGMAGLFLQKSHGEIVPQSIAKIATHSDFTEWLVSHCS